MYFWHTVPCYRNVNITIYFLYLADIIFIMRGIKNIFIYLLFLLCNHVQLLQAQDKKVLFSTAYGDFKVMLYDFTPRHRDLFLESVRDSVYHEALFNRVIDNFVVQGGEHDIDVELREALHPEMPKQRFPAEFDSRAIHKVGALGMGRDANEEKASFLHQIYFVVGKEVEKSYLDEIAKKKGIQYSAEQERTYLEIGGQPRLDQDYTVFGEVYDGLDVLMNIAKAKTDDLDFPVVSIPFKITIID